MIYFYLLRVLGEFDLGHFVRQTNTVITLLYRLPYVTKLNELTLVLQEE